MTTRPSVVAPDRLGLDDVLDVVISGVPKEQSVTVRAALDTDDGVHWSSEAHFAADEDGSVRLASSAALRGSYEGVDGNGLLWSLAPDDVARAEAAKAIGALDPLAVEITAFTEDQELGGAGVTIEQCPRGITQVAVRTNALYGELFVPEGDGPFRPVLVLGGSDGGINPGHAAYLAGHGYLALALGYFAVPGRPDELVEIELEYFERGLAWLTSRPEASGPPAVVGRSRGGELSLLLGLTFELETVIAYVPSPIVHSGITAGTDGWISDLPAWTYGGKVVPYFSHADGLLYDLGGGLHTPDGVIACTPTYLDCLDDWDRVEAAMIELEGMRSDVLLLSGAQDLVWPSSLYSELAMTRLRRRRDGRQRHVVMPGAGHTFRSPVRPASPTIARHALAGERLAFGGDPRSNAAAGPRANAEVLRALAGDFSEQDWR